jgi:hypothetical protein
MTAITASQAVVRPAPRVTGFERTLLRAASALDLFVAGRVARRGDAEYRRAVLEQSVGALARSDAQARAAIGILPR